MEDTRSKPGDLNSRRDFIGVTSSGLLVAALSEPAAAAPSPPSSTAAATAIHDRKFICSDGLHNKTTDGITGYVVKVRLTDYRSLPLSCIAGMELTVDGRSVDASTMTLTLGEDSYKLKDLPALHTKTWWVLDTAELFVPSGTSLTPGEHSIAGTLIFLLPYATGGSITLQSSASKRLVLED